MSCRRCDGSEPLWADPQMWAAGTVIGFLFFCSVVALYYAAVGMGWLGFAVVGMLLYATPGYLLSQMAAGKWAEAKVRVGAGPSSRPKWTQRLPAPEASRPAPTEGPDDGDPDGRDQGDEDAEARSA